jgi:aryl-alcohol dehydrogenase-like predicted oxidoreductase
MVTHNLAYQEELAVIEQAEQKNKGILIKKAFASGHVANSQHEDPVQASLDLIFKQAAVSSVVIGTINPNHLEDNVRKAQIALKKC